VSCSKQTQGSYTTSKNIDLFFIYCKRQRSPGAHQGWSSSSIKSSTGSNKGAKVNELLQSATQLSFVFSERIFKKAKSETSLRASTP